MPALLVALLALGASPTLTIRLLERERPTEATVAADELRCDGSPLGRFAQIRAAGNAIVAGEKRCRELTTGRNAAIALGQTSRRYRGSLRIAQADGKLAFFETATVDEYLYGVVASEMDAAPAEALRAQAIVSRTFALSQRGRHRAAGYDLCDLTHCQLYRGRDGERAETTAAVDQTSGQVLLVGGVVLAPAYFHASCGGATSSPEDVFGQDGLVDAARDGCSDRFTWQIDRASLAQALGQPPVGSAFEVLRRDRAGRAIEIRSFGARYSGAAFLSLVGRAFGYLKLKSVAASAEEVEGQIRFTGRGHGHGVGLCQKGARSLAEREKDHRHILEHYFPTRMIGPAP